MKRIIGLPIVAATLALAACGTIHHNTTTNTPTTAVNYSSEYAAIDDPLNTQTNTIMGQLGTAAANPDSTIAQIQAVMAPMTTDYQQADLDLTTMTWPANLQPAISKQVQDNRTLLVDLSNLNTQTIDTVSNWTTGFMDDGIKTAADADVVRGLLGLPPVTS
jgi:hypothetical protein